MIHESVVADADRRLAQVVLENLLGNAWKFTAKTAHPRIEFGVRDQDGLLTYFVQDNGAGFDMTYVKKLFALFPASSFGSDVSRNWYWPGDCPPRHRSPWGARVGPWRRRSRRNLSLDAA